MSSDIRRLVAAYRWLQGERSLAARSQAGVITAKIDSELDRLFLDIVRQPSELTGITALQIECVIEQLVRLADDAEQANGLAEICRAHLNSIAKPHQELQRSQPVKPQDAFTADARRFFDSASDRIGIIDRRYRYITTNRSNANFHGCDASHFPGNPIWDFVGEAYFDQLMRPSLDLCFKNELIDYVVMSSNKGIDYVLSIKMDPMHGDDGEVTAIAVTAREVHVWDPAALHDYRRQQRRIRTPHPR